MYIHEKSIYQTKTLDHEESHGTSQQEGQCHKKWWKSHAEKNRAKSFSLHSQAQATVHKLHKEYTESILNLDIIKHSEYKKTSNDK